MPLNLNRPVTHEERQWNNAVSKARRNFGYFWREVYWDSQRQESQCEFAAALFEFSEEQNGKLVSERVWLSDIWCLGPDDLTELLYEKNQPLPYHRRYRLCWIPWPD